MIGPLHTCDSNPYKVESLLLCDIGGKILPPFIGPRGGVASMTYRGLGTIVGVLEAEGLTNLTFNILSLVASSE